MIRDHHAKAELVRAFLQMVVLRRRFVAMKDKSVLLQRYLRGFNSFRKTKAKLTQMRNRRAVHLLKIHMTTVENQTLHSMAKVI